MSTVLTTSSINSLISQYEITQRESLVSPLQTRKKKYESINTSFDEITTKLTSLKSALNNFRQTGADSIFAKKTATSSNSNFVSATASKTSAAGSYSLNVSQLAKNDLAVSQSLTSSTANAITGKHTFQIVTGDGSTGQYVSNIEVDFDEAPYTNLTMMQAISDAVNYDKAEVTSTAKAAAGAYEGGASEFLIDVNGEEYSVVVNGGGTYSEMMDEVIAYIDENIEEVAAEKVISETGEVSLKLTVNDSSNYISISHTSGFDLVGDLGIELTKEKAASAAVTASVYTPASGNSQLSISSKLTGVDNRIKSLSDTGTSSALAQLSLNLGTDRPEFSQSLNTAGFLYTDITAETNKLNSRFTINGLSLQNNLNSFSDVVDGLTINLNSVMDAADPDAAITVTTNTSEIKTDIEEFVSKFNDLYVYIKNESLITKDSRGTLVGQSNASSILSFLRSTVTTGVSGVTQGEIKYLTQMGITFDSATGLSISDSSLLEKKINENLDEVENLFNSTTGIASTLYNKVNPYLGANGYLARSKESMTNSVEYVKDRISAAENRITKQSDLLRQRYEALQSQLASLLNTQAQFFGSSSISLTDLYS